MESFVAVESLRLDTLLKKQFPEFSRAYFQHLIENKLVRVDGHFPKKRSVPAFGAKIEVDFQPISSLDLTPENIPLDILYEDEHIIAVNKSAGMVTHPAPGSPKGTFANALLFHCQHLEETGDPLRPGIVHRLDKDTSGVIIAAKTAQAHANLCEQFAKRTVEKTYIAICHGNPNTLFIDSPIARHPIHRKQMHCDPKGRKAQTSIELLAKTSEHSLLLLKPKTGRTHQIRVHLKSLNCPIVGDPLYGSSIKNFNRHLLHAYKLTIAHPVTHKLLSFKAPIPKEFVTCQDFGCALQSLSNAQTL